jgi:DNA repair photolyase
MRVTHSEVKSILTRTSGFLATVTSHSLQPYRGCALGSSLCGVGCYVRHNVHLTKGQPWGSFVEVRANAADAYRRQYATERAWARAQRGRFGVFLSSSTEPFQPLEQQARTTRGVLEAMSELPPDLLILQTHSHHVTEYAPLYEQLHAKLDLRIHISVESDRDALPGLPRSASPVARRIAAARALRERGLFVVGAVSPLLPIDRPDAFFATLSEACDAVVIDHYIGGDGSSDGSRTRRTPLPIAMQQVEPASVTLEYRDRIVEIAQRYFEQVGVNIDGFAGRWLPRGEPRGNFRSAVSFPILRSEREIA